MQAFFLIILTIGLAVEFASAQTGFAPNDPQKKSIESSEGRPAKTRRFKKTFVEFGGDLRSYVYHEPDVVKHSGLLYGIWGNFVTSTAFGTFGVDGVYSYAKGTRYDGSLCDLDTGDCTPYSTNNQTDVIAKTKAVVYLTASNVLRFKGGVGYRYYANSVSEPGFYLRKGTYFYLPVAAEILVESDPVFKWRFELGYDYVLSGGINSSLSDVSSNFNDVYMSQKGYGLNASAQLRYRGRYLVSLFYETWSLEESDIVFANATDGFREPQNTATAIGVRIGYDFY